MPLSLVEITQRTAPATFTFLGETVNLDYYPARVSVAGPFELEAAQKRAMAAAEEAEKRGEDGVAAARRVMAEFVCELLAGWDLVENKAPDGTPGPRIPVTVERVAQIDPGFLGECLTAIFAAARMGKAERTPSSAPLPRTSSRQKRAATSLKKRG